jgi:hypothetical protein
VTTPGAGNYQANQQYTSPIGPNPQATPAEQRAQAQQQAQAQARVDAENRATRVRGLRAFAATRDRFRNMPTPGGIGMLVLILVVLLFALVAVNGKSTRLNLLFDVGTGTKRLPSEGNNNANMPTGDTNTTTTSFTGTVGAPQTPTTPALVIPPSSPSPAPGILFPDFSPSGIPMPGVAL